MTPIPSNARIEDFPSLVNANMAITLQVNTVTLTQSDILSLDTTPFTIVPAAGAGTIVLPFAIRWTYNFVTTPYRGPCTASQYIGIWWDNNTNAFSYILPP